MKRNEKQAERARAARARRAERWEALFSPGLLAAAGATASLAYLFQPVLWLKALLFAFFLVAALSSGKKASLLATVLVSLGIIGMNVLVPVGRVLGRWGPFTLTETALLEGIDKALTFEGLLYASKAAIRSSLRIPGRFGSIMASAFLYYDRIIEYRGRVLPASFMKDADELMLAVWENGGDGAAPPQARLGTKTGSAVLVAAMVASLGFLALGFLIS